MSVPPAPPLPPRVRRPGPAHDDFGPARPALGAIDDAPPWLPPDERVGEDCGPGGQAAADEDDARDLLRLAMRKRMLRGGSFILDAPAQVAAVWGDGDRVLWPEDEPTMLFGPTGVGKGTLAQQVVMARLGIAHDVLGFPVAPELRRVLYVAADRPTQARRSMARMVTEAHRDVLDERLIVWRGPLPGDLMKTPDLLRMMAEAEGAGTIIIDSLKDIAHKLSDDETGGRANGAFQACVADGIQVLVLHHPRKATSDNRKPNTIDDVYGSTWFTAGMGSVLCLWGKPGDAVVELYHLKQPAEQIEPMTILHDHRTGHSTVEHGIDLLAVVRTSTGLNAEGAARAIFRADDPDRNQVEKARRQLDRLVANGLAHAEHGGKNAAGQQQPTRYYAVVREPS